MAKQSKSNARKRAGSGKKGLSPQTRRLAAQGEKQSKQVSEALRQDRGGRTATPSRQDVKRVVPRMQRDTRS